MQARQPLRCSAQVQRAALLPKAQQAAVYLRLPLHRRLTADSAILHSWREWALCTPVTVLRQALIPTVRCEEGIGEEGGEGRVKARFPAHDEVGRGTALSLHGWEALVLSIPWKRPLQQ